MENHEKLFLLFCYSRVASSMMRKIFIWKSIFFIYVYSFLFILAFFLCMNHTTFQIFIFPIFHSLFFPFPYRYSFFFFESIHKHTINRKSTYNVLFNQNRWWGEKRKSKIEQNQLMFTDEFVIIKLFSCNFVSSRKICFVKIEFFLFPCEKSNFVFRWNVKKIFFYFICCGLACVGVSYCGRNSLEWKNFFLYNFFFHYRRIFFSSLLFNNCVSSARHEKFPPKSFFTLTHSFLIFKCTDINFFCWIGFVFPKLCIF
jgi:hypothetical protein